MNKINGYTAEEAGSLVKYVCEGKIKGKTLTRIFEEYAARTGRAKGSVRNYYYALLKKQDDERVRRMLAGKDLHAGAVKPFTEEETDEMLRLIFRERAKGCSVRRAIMNAAGGDEKKMLRMQNKYRNLLKKQPERLEKAAKEAGVPAGSEFLQRRLEQEIDALYRRIAGELRRENEALRSELEKLRSERGE